MFNLKKTAAVAGAGLLSLLTACKSNNTVQGSSGTINADGKFIPSETLSAVSCGKFSQATFSYPEFKSKAEIRTESPVISFARIIEGVDRALTFSFHSPGPQGVEPLKADKGEWPVKMPEKAPLYQDPRFSDNVHDKLATSIKKLEEAELQQQQLADARAGMRDAALKFAIHGFPTPSQESSSSSTASLGDSTFSSMAKKLYRELTFSFRNPKPQGVEPLKADKGEWPVKMPEEPLYQHPRFSDNMHDRLATLEANERFRSALVSAREIGKGAGLVSFGLRSNIGLKESSTIDGSEREAKSPAESPDPEKKK